MAVEIIVILGLAAGRGLIPAWQAIQLLGGLAVLIALLATALGWQDLWSHFRQHELFEGRKELNQSSWQMAQARPWWGFGLGTWATVYPGFALYDDGRKVNQAHNDWAEWAVEGGLAFVSLFALLAVLSVRPAFQSLWGIGVLSVLAHCAVDYPIQQEPALAGWFFIFLGASTAAARKPRTRRTAALKAEQ